MTRLPRASIVIASVALFVALNGGAVAAGIVPLARHAFTADRATNATKLGGKTPAQLRLTFRGARGPQGIQGPQGPAGAAGPAGPAGPKGDTGAVGARGATGSTGSQGPKGDVGSGLQIVGTVATAGDLPVSGTTGDAYLVGGNLYVWTGSAWTNAGPVQGPKGDTGNTGPIGPQGPQGIQGPAGTAGTAAVSVHSSDFTLAASGTAGDAALVTANCSAGQKAVAGGFDSNGNVANEDTAPTVADDGWSIFLFNTDNSPSSGKVYVTCLG
jgi:hypothetical protein